MGLNSKQRAYIPLSQMGMGKKTSKVPPGSARPEVGVKASVKGKGKK